jgi:hypothetical protein
LVGCVEANDLVAIEGIGEIDLDLDESLLNEMLLCIGLLFVLKWSSVYPDRYFNATADSNEWILALESISQSRHACLPAIVHTLAFE